MRVRVWVLRCLAAGVGLSSVLGWAASGTVNPKSGCVRGVVEGEVQAGAGFARPIGDGLKVKLEPLASGWIVRVLPVSGQRPAHDYAELATPPYESVSPLLISTDYSFRAQDVVAWNPRRFRFAADGREFQQIAAVYAEYRKSNAPPVEVQDRLAKLVSAAPEGTVRILDAHLVPGTADQARAAAGVASHFSATPHTLEQPTDGRATALGKLTWMRFRIELDLPAGFLVDRRLAVERRACR